MKEQLLNLLENSKNYTLAVAMAMPHNKYNARPSENVWDFGELLSHIAYGIRWWEDNYIKGIKTPWEPPTPKTGKKEVLELLEKAYAGLQSTKLIQNDSLYSGFEVRQSVHRHLKSTMR